MNTQICTDVLLFIVFFLPYFSCYRWLTRLSKNPQKAKFALSAFTFSNPHIFSPLTCPGDALRTYSSPQGKLFQKILYNSCEKWQTHSA